MKKIQNILERLNSVKVGAPGSLLVFETNGFVLYGALAHAGVASLEFEAVGESKALEFSTAIGEVLEQLRSQTKKRLPKKAVLITPSALSVLLELPVNPNNPRNKAQMSEMVRWELEPLFSQQNEIWSIGALLMGRGYIDAVQRREILTEMELRNDSGPGRVSARFGELAQDLGYVTREQIDECLALQEKLVLFDDEVVSGWSPQANADDEERREQFLWLAAGVGDAMRKQWAAAFRKQGVFLSWIYPQLGGVFGAIGLASGAREHMVVDIRQEQFAVVRGQLGNMASMRIEPCREGQANPDDCAALCHEQMRPDINKIYLAVEDGMFEQVSNGLAQRLEREVATLPLPGLSIASSIAIPGQILASLGGVAAHALGHIASGVLPRIEAQPPKPPIWKRRDLWPYAAAAVLLLAVSGYDLSLRYQTWQNQGKLELLDEEYNEKMQIKKQADSAASEVAALKGKLQQQGDVFAGKQQQMHIINEIILKRQQSVPGILRTVGESIGDEVMLDLLEEGERQSGYHLKGWAVTDTSGQLFLNRLNKNLAQWNYHISDAQVRSGQGRLGIQGYTLDVWLSPGRDNKGAKG